MNLLTSYRWLREYVACDLAPEAFAARLSLSGPAVEKLIPRDANFEHIVVGKILKVDTHPQADRLRVLSVDVGQAAPITIVCGGSNVAEEQFVVVALLGARVKWHGEGDLVTMELTKIRGVESHGMVCGADEIGLSEAFPKGDEKEILDLGCHLPSETLTPGQPVADLLQLSGDVVMDIEVTTNRPDAMCIVGLAREAGAILNLPFKQPNPASITPQAGAQTLDVQVEDTTRCPRYTAVRIEGVTNGESPWWMKERLLSAGLHPISVLVDITNYVMLELGQPLHVFDAAKLKGEQIRVRGAQKGESLQALDGKKYDLEAGMLVIADANEPVAVAGVMGGQNSGVSLETTSIVLECASFDPVSVRRTARALNLYSDAQSLFEKGLSTESPLVGLRRAVELCLTLAGGTVTSEVFDSKTEAYQSKEYAIGVEQARSLIGVNLETEEMTSILERLGFTVRVEDDSIVATVPWWRDHDIEDGRDLVEEIARVHGYANLPSVFPAGISGRPSDPILDVEDRCKTLLQGAGFTEVYSYAFVSEDQLLKTGYPLDAALHLQNPLAAELSYMRPDLLPGMLQVIVDNQERVSEGMYFEIANVFAPTGKGLPLERPMLLAAIVANDEGVWKKSKGIAEALLNEFHVDKVQWSTITEDPSRKMHPGRSGQMGSTEKDIPDLGRFGELHPELLKKWKITQRVAVCGISLESLREASTRTMAYQTVPEAPASKRDIAFTVDQSVTVEEVKRVILSVTTLPTHVEWFDTYRGTGVAEGKKSLAFHLTFQDAVRTLSSEEVDAELARITSAITKDLGAVIRT